MNMSRTRIRKPGMAIACLLLGAIAPNLQAQGVQYTKPHGNSVQSQAQPVRTAPQHYTAHSVATPNSNVMQPLCPPHQQLYREHCVPDRSPQQQKAPAAHSHTYTAHSNLPPGMTPAYASKPPRHTTTTKMIDKSKAQPRPGVPIGQHATESNTHGINFVGGKQALNPQPIPPGHAVHEVPQPVEPVEKPGGH